MAESTEAAAMADAASKDIMSFTEHQDTPPEGLECMCMFEDITKEDGNYVEYQTAPSMTWHPSKYSAMIVKDLKSKQFQKYMDGVSKADCAAALRRAIAEGPPVWMSDRIALPLPAGDTHIVKFWWQETNEETDAKVDGALEGEEREKLWKQQRDCLAEMEAADGKEAAK